MYSNFILLFARLSGFFLISPLFSQKGIPRVIRFGAAIVCSFILAPPLTVHFSFHFEASFPMMLQIVQQVIIGYFMGFLFSLLFEAAAFAGQWVGTAMGFSATELLMPQMSSVHPLMGQFFSWTVFGLFLALDLHHPLLKFLYASFEAFPPLSFSFTHDMASTTIKGMTLLFQQAFAFAAFPLTFLLALIALMALIARFLPIFWVSFPLQLILGFLTIGIGVSLFVPILEKGIWHLLENLKNLIVNF